MCCIFSNVKLLLLKGVNLTGYMYDACEIRTKLLKIKFLISNTIQEYYKSKIDQIIARSNWFLIIQYVKYLQLLLMIWIILALNAVLLVILMIFKIFKCDIQMRPLYWISVNVPYNFMYCRKAKPSKQIFSFPHLYMSLFIFPFPLFPYDTIECFLIKQKVEQSIDFSKEEYKMYLH